jgi:YidC/Oxa1 family membrane protein insertase
MHTIAYLFNLLLYQPLFNILVLLYEYIPGRSFGLAIIILTIAIKLILYPLGSKAIKSQKELSGLQPKIKEIQEKYKDKEEQARELMGLYKKEKINPFSGFLPLFIQLPVLIALYRVFWKGFDPSQLSLLYGFIPSPGSISSLFLGFLDLAKSNAWLAVLVGVTQFLQIKLAMPKNNPQKKSNDFSAHLQKQMQYFMPVFITFVFLSLPAALGIYFIVSALFTIVQQYLILKKNNGTA